MHSATFEMVPFIQRGLTALRGQIWYVWFITALIVVTVAAHTAGAYSRPASFNASFMQHLATQVHLDTPNVVAATPQPKPVTPSPVTPAASVVTATIQTCSRATATIPNPIDLSAQSVGLTQITDPVKIYAVYGSTPAQLRTQLLQCAPTSKDGTSGGVTNYSLVWQFGVQRDGTGMCSVTDAKVGLHNAVTLPRSNSGGTFQTYIHNLTTHENGHVAINQRYAALLLQDLQSFPSSDCANFTAAVQAKLQADVAALNAANTAYDVSTNHGITQGVIIR